METNQRLWVNDLELSKLCTKVGIGILVSGLILLGATFYFFGQNIQNKNWILMFLTGLILILTGVLFLIWGNSETQRVLREGARLTRNISYVKIRYKWDGSLKNTSDFVEYSPQDVKHPHTRNLQPKDIIALKELLEKLISERGVVFKTIEFKPEERLIDPFEFTIKHIYRFILPENIEISVGRLDRNSKNSHAISTTISIFPLTSENKFVVEDWRERIEIKLRDFVSTTVKN